MFMLVSGNRHFKSTISIDSNIGCESVKPNSLLLPHFVELNSVDVVCVVREYRILSILYIQILIYKY